MTATRGTVGTMIECLSLTRGKNPALREQEIYRKTKRGANHQRNESLPIKLGNESNDDCVCNQVRKQADSLSPEVAHQFGPSAVTIEGESMIEPPGNQHRRRKGTARQGSADH